MSKKVKQHMLLLLLLLCTVSLLGCGKKNSGNNTNSSNGLGDETIEETNPTLEESLEAIVEHLMPKDDMVDNVCVFVTGEDEMIGVLTSLFDKPYYKIDSRLKEMVKTDLKAFNEKYADEHRITNALRQEGLGMLGEYAVLSLRFSDWNAYVTYMDTEAYKGTEVTVATLYSAETLSGAMDRSFTSFDGQKTDASQILEETKKEKYHVIKAAGELTVYLERPIAYVSAGAEVVDEYTVKSSKDGVIVITK